MSWKLYAALLVVGASTLASASAVAGSDPDAGKMPTAPMREQVLKLPGDPTRPVTLEATLFEPPGNGPFPLAVMNHGAKGEPRTVERYRVSFSIDYLLSRGYAVIAPMMRGFAGSGGTTVAVGCDDASIGKLDASDILAVIDDMKTRPEIDGSRILVVGQSFGGWNSLALATMAPPEVKGVVDFVGGMRAGTCNRQDEAMFDGMEQFGRESRLPSLWFYGERDEEFSEKVWRTDYERFTKAGGKAELVDFGAIDDAHNLLGHGDRMDLWVPKVDAYLAERGLPNKLVYPEFVPPPRPPKTNYALLADVASVPFIGRSHPEEYQKFLDGTLRPRVLVVSQQMDSRQAGGFDPVARALADCAAHGGSCVLYAYDDDVVWTGPAVSQVARIGGVSIVGRAAKSGEWTMIEQVASLSPTCAPLPLPAVAISAPPAHGTASVEAANDFPAMAASGPRAACNTQRSPVLRLEYQGAPGFVGVDFFTATVTQAGKGPQTIKFAVHVN